MWCDGKAEGEGDGDVGVESYDESECDGYDSDSGDGGDEVDCGVEGGESDDSNSVDEVNGDVKGDSEDSNGVDADNEVDGGSECDGDEVEPWNPAHAFVKMYLTNSREKLIKNNVSFFDIFWRLWLGQPRAKAKTSKESLIETRV